MKRHVMLLAAVRCGSSPWALGQDEGVFIDDLKGRQNASQQPAR